MAKKTPPVQLGKDLLKKLTAMGITATTEAEARTELLEKLVAAGYEGFEDDTTENLIDIASAIIEPEAEGGEEETTEEETTEGEEEAAAEEEEEEEVAEPVPAKKGKTKPTTTDDELDEAVAETKGKGKTAPAPAKKAAAPAAAAPAKKAAAPKKDATPKAGNSFDKGNAEHMTLAKKIFEKIFSPKLYLIGGISGGISIRLLGDNVKIVVLKYSNVSIDGQKLAGNLNFKKIKDVDELQALLPAAFQDMEIERVDTRGYVRINKITDAQITLLFKDPTVLATVLKKGKDIDTKMGNNRKKLENTLASGKKGKGDTAPEEEEEEVAAPVPAKKPTPPPTKKAVPAAAPVKAPPAPAKKTPPPPAKKK